MSPVAEQLLIKQEISINSTSDKSIQKLKYFTELDGVRAIAALMIMVFHYFHDMDVDAGSAIGWIKKISMYGQSGVSLFFVLSGFLITRILLSTKEKKGYFAKFYFKRALRIFPLYYFFLILSCLAVPMVLNMPIVSMKEQFYFWIYLQNFAYTFNWNIQGPQHFWSLAVEEHFYFFWPFVVYYFSTKNIFKAILGTIIISIVVRAVLTYYSYETFYFTFSRIDELAVGALIALMECKNRLVSKNVKWFLIAAILFMIPAFILRTQYSGTGVAGIQIFKYNFLSTLYFFFLCAIISLRDNSRIKTFFQIRPLIFSGKISYGLYVYHPLCYFIVKKFFLIESVVLEISACFMMTYFVASFSYYYFEAKFLALKPN